MEPLQRNLDAGEAQRLRQLLKGPGQAAYRRFLDKTGDPARSMALSRNLLKELAAGIGPDDGAEQVALRARVLTERQLAILELERAQAAWEALDDGSVPIYTRAPAVQGQEAKKCAAPAPKEPDPPEERPAHRLELPDFTPLEPDAEGLTRRARKARRQEERCNRPAPSAQGGGRLVLEALAAALLIVLCLLLAWCALGMLMRLELVPKLDLGYQFFNAHIYPLF